jgi:hypothetical protein
MDFKEDAKKYWPWVAGAVVGYFVIVKLMGSGSTSAAASGASDASVLAAASANAAAANSAATTANNQYQLAQTQLSDQNALATATLQAQSLASGQAAQVANVSAIGGVITNIGTMISSTLASQAQIPVAAINAAAAGNQVALAAAASVASAGVQALPGTLSASAQLVEAQYAPLQSYGSTLVGLADGVASTAASAMNGVAQAGSSGASAAASSSAASVQASNSSSSQMFSTLGTLGTVALLAA